MPTTELVNLKRRLKEINPMIVLPQCEAGIRMTKETDERLVEVVALNKAIALWLTNNDFLRWLKTSGCTFALNLQDASHVEGIPGLSVASDPNNDYCFVVPPARGSESNTPYPPLLFVHYYVGDEAIFNKTSTGSRRILGVSYCPMIYRGQTASDSYRGLGPASWYPDDNFLGDEQQISPFGGESMQLEDPPGSLLLRIDPTLTHGKLSEGIIQQIAEINTNLRAT